jgi:crotonobetainyl-CoA:carnitine CoA-transferase CaiB-like acyl-CoA transferase
VIALPAGQRDDGRDPDATTRAVAERIRSRTAEEWRAAFAGRDLCCNVVSSIEDALADPHFRGRGLFDGRLTAGGASIAALPLPIAPAFRSDAPAGYPALGEANALLDAGSGEN